MIKVTAKINYSRPLPTALQINTAIEKGLANGAQYTKNAMNKEIVSNAKFDDRTTRLSGSLDAELNKVSAGYEIGVGRISKMPLYWYYVEKGSKAARVYPPKKAMPIVELTGEVFFRKSRKAIKGVFMFKKTYENTKDHIVTWVFKHLVDSLVRI